MLRVAAELAVAIAAAAVRSVGVGLHRVIGRDALPVSLKKAASNSLEPFHFAVGSHCDTENVYSAYGPAPLSFVGNSAAANPVPADV